MIKPLLRRALAPVARRLLTEPPAPSSVYGISGDPDQGCTVHINGKDFRVPADENGYWAARYDHPLYRLTEAMARGFFADARSAIDVGCYTSGLIVELDWIERRIASDINPFLKDNWKRVEGVNFEYGDAFKKDFEEKFDLVLSNQTIEHLEDPVGFVEKLLELGRGLIISTTYETEAGLIEGHVQDPISLEKFKSWFPVELDGWAVCHHPTSRQVQHIVGVIKDSHPARAGGF